MRGVVKTVLIGAIGLFIVNGCGSSSNDDLPKGTPENTSKDSQSNGNSNKASSTKVYSGAVGAGDYVEAKFDPNTKKLEYTMSGAFADKYDLHKGSYTLTKMFGNFYKYGNGDLVFFASNNLSIAHVDMDGKEFNFATLASVDKPKSSDLVGKTFNAGVFINGENPDVCKISFNSSSVNFGPCVKSDLTAQYKWSLDDKKIVIKDSDTKVAQAIFKNGKRDSLIVDLVNLNGESGIAVALESKALEAKEVNNEATFKAMDVTYYGGIDFSKTKVFNKNGNVYADITDLTESGGVENSYPLTLTLNPTIKSQKWDGLAQVNGRTSQYALFSKDDGFYLAINTEPNGSFPYVLSFGSNKPLK